MLTKWYLFCAYGIVINEATGEFEHATMARVVVTCLVGNIFFPGLQLRKDTCALPI